MNECAGEPLVDLATGGTGGGGARLTALGKEALAEYQRILQRLNRVAGGKARRRNRK
jgi:molybdate transport system regulatory protein